MNAFIWVCARTPLHIAWLFSWTLTWLWWTVLPYRRATAIEGYRRAFPDRRPGPDLRRMLAGVVLGYFELFREMRKPGTVKVEYRNQEALLKDLAAGQGSFLLGGHFGAWDLVAVMTCRDLKLPVSVTVKTPRNPAVAAQIENVRKTFGMGLLPVQNCMERIYEEVQNGRMVAFLLDQRFNRGLVVPFFGEGASTSPALAAAAAKTGAPVHTLRFQRLGIGRHLAEFGPPLPISGDLEADLTTIMQFYEAQIRRDPHNWFWLHDRWRRRAGGD